MGCVALCVIKLTAQHIEAELETARLDELALEVRPVMSVRG